MAKSKVEFACSECGSVHPKWQGQCPDCGAWNSLIEQQAASKAIKKMLIAKGYSGAQASTIVTANEVDIAALPRLSSTLSELDRVLGGGIVTGSVILLGGDPGVGKSSLLIQVLACISQERSVLYVSGEESLSQIVMRGQRMQLPLDTMRFLAETEVERITDLAVTDRPQIMVIDSIQTMQIAELGAAAGGVSQVRESAAYLTRFAKQNNIAIFLVGHVTKTGEVAGPRVLEHIVDTVLFLEGDSDSRFRTLRAIKNRFGAVNELGVFAMTELGLKQIKNPSAIFLSRRGTPAPGSVITVIWEGSRPLLIELQALVADSPFGQPRRVSVGIDSNRIAMLLAVLQRHGGIQAADQDVYINVVGGIKVTETSTDLALLLAILSSLRNRVFDASWLVFGEVGLSGEIRPVPSGQERIMEAAKHGFKRAIVPKANMPKVVPKDIEVIGVECLADALAAVG